MNKFWNWLKENGIQLVWMLIGSGLIAFASKCIYDPNGMVTGGVSGLSIIIKWVAAKQWGIEIPLWVTSLLFNVPLMLIAWKKKGLAFIARVIFATMAFSMWLAVLPQVTIADQDMVLATIFGALLAGTGTGLVLRAKSTTGGTDTIAMLLHDRFRHLSVVQILQVVDGAIVLLGVAVFGINRTLYAIVAVYVTSRVSDRLLEGAKFAKQVFVVTNESEIMAKEIMEQMDRGVTGLHAVGMYSNEEKTMLYCVLDKKEIVTLKELAHRVDPQAFLVVNDAREVLGEGFLAPGQEF